MYGALLSLHNKNQFVIRGPFELIELEDGWSIPGEEYIRINFKNEGWYKLFPDVPDENIKVADSFLVTNSHEKIFFMHSSETVVNGFIFGCKVGIGSDRLVVNNLNRAEVSVN